MTIFLGLLRHTVNMRFHDVELTCARAAVSCCMYIKELFVVKMMKIHYCRENTERRVPELIPVLGSQPAGDVSHKPGDRLPLLSATAAVTLATLKRAATNFTAW